MVIKKFFSKVREKIFFSGFLKKFKWHSPYMIAFLEASYVKLSKKGTVT